MQRVSFVAKMTIRQYAMIVQLPICNAPQKKGSAKRSISHKYTGARYEPWA